MDKNHEWQRQYANQRLAARRREAEIHRALQQDAAEQSREGIIVLILRRIGRALAGSAGRRQKQSADARQSARVTFTD